MALSKAIWQVHYGPQDYQDLANKHVSHLEMESPGFGATHLTCRNKIRPSKSKGGYNSVKGYLDTKDPVLQWSSETANTPPNDVQI